MGSAGTWPPVQPPSLPPPSPDPATLPRSSQLFICVPHFCTRDIPLLGRDTGRWHSGEFSFFGFNPASSNFCLSLLQSLKSLSLAL